MLNENKKRPAEEIDSHERGPEEEASACQPPNKKRRMTSAGMEESSDVVDAEDKEDHQDDHHQDYPPMPVPKVYNADGPYAFDGEIPEPKEKTGDMVSLFELPWPPVDAMAGVFENASKLHGGTYTYDEAAYDASIQAKEDEAARERQERREREQGAPKKTIKIACECCGAEVPADTEDLCEACGERPVQRKTSEELTSFFANRPEQWLCWCTTPNPAAETKCLSCERPRDGAHGAPTAASTPGDATAGEPKDASKGLSSNVSTGDAASKNVPAVSGASAGGSAGSKATSFSFGYIAPTASAAAFGPSTFSNGFSFGFGAPTSNGGGAGFSFGAPASGDATTRPPFASPLIQPRCFFL